ncbi:MAG: hypothetical protein WCV90_01800 [Candidatus Woesearchaeota archaeon]|jgi:hypothetical protein
MTKKKSLAWLKGAIIGAIFGLIIIIINYIYLNFISYRSDLKYEWFYYIFHYSGAAYLVPITIFLWGILGYILIIVAYALIGTLIGYGIGKLLSKK